MHILIIDDHVCIAKGMARIFEDEKRVAITSTASCWNQAESIIRSQRVNVILLDIELSGNENGFDLIPCIKACDENIKIVIFSNHDNYIYRAKARVLGADEYITKGSDYEVLIDKIIKVCDQKERASAFTNRSSCHNTLSEKEEAVIHCLAKGMSQKQIAVEFHTKPSTIATYVQRAKAKLGVYSIAELVMAVGLLKSR